MKLQQDTSNITTLRQRLLTLFAIMLFCFAFISISSVNAQDSDPSTGPEIGSSNNSRVDSTTQFTDTTNKTVGDYFKDMPLPAELSTTPIRGELRQFPLLYWRAWAAQPVPFLPALVFLLFTSTIVYYLIPSIIDTTKRTAQSSFWRSLLTGLIACMVSIALAQLFFLSKIATPLAQLTLSLLEVGVVIGYTTAALLIGETILSLLGLFKTQTIEFTDKNAPRVEVKNVCALLLGLVILATLLLIPGITTTMPRIGTRIVMLFALIGWGGCLRKYLLGADK